LEEAKDEADEDDDDDGDGTVDECDEEEAGDGVEISGSEEKNRERRR
jgi:hypothetical protein